MMNECCYYYHDMHSRTSASSKLTNNRIEVCCFLFLTLYSNLLSDTHEAKVDVFVKIILHNSTKEKFYKDDFVSGQEVLLNYNLTENLI